MAARQPYKKLSTRPFVVSSACDFGPYTYRDVSPQLEAATSRAERHACFCCSIVHLFGFHALARISRCALPATVGVVAILWALSLFVQGLRTRRATACCRAWKAVTCTTVSCLHPVVMTAAWGKVSGPQAALLSHFQV